MSRYYGVPIVLGIAMLAAAAARWFGRRGDAAEAASGETILRIKVLQSGTVIVDEQPTGAAELHARLSALEGTNAVVWYYRENSKEAATPAAMEALEAVAEHRIPISISSMPDFSDYIDGEGISHPREK